MLSLGSFNLNIVHENIILEHKFHLVHDNFPIPSNGIIGKDFIKRFKYLIDYGDMTFTVRKTDESSITYDINSELLPGVSALPPRSETFKMFYIKSEKFPCVVQTQEIEKGVLILTTIAYEPKSWLRVLNITEEGKIISTENVESSPLDNFHIVKLNSEINANSDRELKLRKILKTKVPEHARNKLLNLCVKF